MAEGSVCQGSESLCPDPLLPCSFGLLCLEPSDTCPEVTDMRPVHGSPQCGAVDGSALLWDLLVRRVGLDQVLGIPVGYSYGGPVKPWAVGLPQVSGNPLGVAEGGKDYWKDSIAWG